MRHGKIGSFAVLAAWFDGWGGKGGGVKIDCRPVHACTLTDDVEYIKPKARVY